MIHEAVIQINDSIIVGLKLEDIKKYTTYGICDVAIVNTKNRQKSFPALIDVDGESVYPFLDDNFDIGLYHRLHSNRYITPINSGFGREKDVIVESDMMLVVWGFTKKLQKTKYEVEELIRKHLQENILLFQSTFDSLQIFNREFKGYKFNIRPEEFVFSIQYKVRYREKRC